MEFYLLELNTEARLQNSLNVKQVVACSVLTLSPADMSLLNTCIKRSNALLHISSYIYKLVHSFASLISCQHF